MLWFVKINICMMVYIVSIALDDNPSITLKDMRNKYTTYGEIRQKYVPEINIITLVIPRSALTSTGTLGWVTVEECFALYTRAAVHVRIIENGTTAYIIMLTFQRTCIHTKPLVS